MTAVARGFRRPVADQLHVLDRLKTTAPDRHSRWGMTRHIRRETRPESMVCAQDVTEGRRGCVRAGSTNGPTRQATHVVERPGKLRIEIPAPRAPYSKCTGLTWGPPRGLARAVGQLSRSYPSPGRRKVRKNAPRRRNQPMLAPDHDSAVGQDPMGGQTRDAVTGWSSECSSISPTAPRSGAGAERGVRFRR